MLTIHVLPRRLKEFLLTHPLYKSPAFVNLNEPFAIDRCAVLILEMLQALSTHNTNNSQK